MKDCANMEHQITEKWSSTYKLNQSKLSESANKCFNIQPPKPSSKHLHEAIVDEVKALK